MEGLRKRYLGAVRGRRSRTALRPLPWWRMKHFMRLPSVARHTIMRVVEHDCLNVAQSAAYSAIFALFPALIVTAAIAPLLPHAAPLRFQVAHFFERVLPPDVTPVLETYFTRTPDPQSTSALVIAALVSITGASSVIATLMEGFRRAHDLPVDCWGFWQRRARAFVLVPLSLLPFAAASILLVFGQVITHWFTMHLSHTVEMLALVLGFAIRWVVALLGSTGVIALIYHMGTPMRQAWHRTLPGAVVATGMWFFTTLVFGWYVTRFANYGKVYGSLGAGIALLFWLYIISLSILSGAEFNAQFFHEKTLLVTGSVPARTVPHN